MGSEGEAGGAESEGENEVWATLLPRRSLFYSKFPLHPPLSRGFAFGNGDGGK